MRACQARAEGPIPSDRTKLEPIGKTNDSEKSPRTGEYASNPEKKKYSLLL